ncbi:MAG: YraN family protein [Bacteroidetes bacterium]|nr:YraN family protein [Bacteroidota bacterium]MBK9672928.1 YraN family protein [Bacteroidota bacterium]
MAIHNDTGKFGELKAVEYLLSKGYKILDTNWRYEKSELDIVCEYNEFIVVLEVKTRSSTYFGSPADFVGAAKQQKIIEGAEAYLEVKNLDRELRFDILEVVLSNNTLTINHIEAAFNDGM